MQIYFLNSVLLFFSEQRRQKIRSGSPSRTRWWIGKRNAGRSPDPESGQKSHRFSEIETTFPSQTSKRIFIQHSRSVSARRSQTGRKLGFRFGPENRWVSDFPRQRWEQDFPTQARRKWRFGKFQFGTSVSHLRRSGNGTIGWTRYL
jgi:hypothetical protein